MKYKYFYSGPLYRFERIYVAKWEAHTEAVSDKQAINNFNSKAKKEYGFEQWAKLNIDPRYLTLSDEYEDEPDIDDPNFKPAPKCDKCGKELNDAGQCPVCDLGDESALEEDIEKHDTLNPKLWNEDSTLKPEVEEKINLIVEDFLKNLEEDGIKINVKDIKLVGSNCSYNYTKDSDLDVHIVADTKSLKCPDNLYPLLYSAYRSIWNKNHNIEFYGIPVELFVETDDTVDMNAADQLTEAVEPESAFELDEHLLSLLRQLIYGELDNKLYTEQELKNRGITSVFYQELCELIFTYDASLDSLWDDKSAIFGEEGIKRHLLYEMCKVASEDTTTFELYKSNKYGMYTIPDLLLIRNNVSTVNKGITGLSVFLEYTNAWRDNPLKTSDFERIDPWQYL